MRNIRKRIFAISILLAGLATVTAAPLASAQIAPSADSYTNTAAPKQNYGSSTLLNLDSGSETAYINFNLGSIPPSSGSSIAQATLKLYVNSVTTPGTFNVDLVTSSWAENKITADNPPTLGSTIVSGVEVTTANVNNYLLIDITAALNDWLNGEEALNGIALVPNSPLNVSFDSKENTGTSHPAELDVVFAGGGTLKGINTETGSGLTGGGSSGSLSLSLTTSCAANQMLEWNGSAWACATPSPGTLTVVNAGTGLSGGGSSGNVAVSVTPLEVPLLGVPNTFTGVQTILGNMVVPSIVSASQQVMLNNAPNANNTFLGGAGSSTSTNYQVGVGAGALANVVNGAAVSTVQNDTAIGNNALASVGNDSFTAVGFYAGQDLDGTTMEGNQSAPVWLSPDQETFINDGNNTFLGAGSALTTGDLYNATAIGSNAVVGQSNSLVLGCVANLNSCGQSVNVGIGTTSPQQTLDVSGGNAIVRGPGFSGLNTQGNLYLGDMSHMIGAQWGLGLNILTYNDYDTMVIYDGNGGAIGGTVAIGYFQSPPNNIFAIQQGYGPARADGWNVYSSRRWKTNIETLHGALNKVNRLRGVSYDTKGTGQHQIGVIAEEVGAVVPEVVSWEDNGKDARSVDYARLTALLIEATKGRQHLIQKQQRQIEAQHVQIRAMHKAANAEQARINELAVQVRRSQAVLAASSLTDSHPASTIAQLAMALVTWMTR